MNFCHILHVCSVLTDDSVGRPKLDVTREEIIHLKQLNYSWTKIAEILQISRQTLYRQLEEFGIDSCKFSPISESDLDNTLKDIKVSHPSSGEVMMQGHLLHRGIKVPRAKLRSAIHRVDHINTISRRTSVIRRRVYSTPCPHAVWHVDGNHKMIKWRMIIHAGVDGFSRLITFIRCANNNLASTMLEAFLQGVSVYGLPKAVRSDHGGENVDVWRHMLSIHQVPSCVVTGNSVHNERIERMWRDVTRNISSSFIATFFELEAEQVLNPDNEVDIFCLHVVFLPRINKNLAEFQGSWNNHSLSTEGNMSPLQLCVLGLLSSDQPANPPSTGAPSLNFDNLDSVEIPCNKFEPCDELIDIVESAVDPTAQANNNGKTLYYRIIHLVGQHLQAHCTLCKCN